jgi:hypothetical protein
MKFQVGSKVGFVKDTLISKVVAGDVGVIEWVGPAHCDVTVQKGEWKRTFGIENEFIVPFQTKQTPEERQTNESLWDLAAE